MREYETGATRDAVEGKLRYEGFLSPRVLRRYAEYMHQHRVQADGKLRDPDNWQHGIPMADYIDSLVRHTIDLWFAWRERGRMFADEELLCAILFNVMGALYETTRPAFVTGFTVQGHGVPSGIADVHQDQWPLPLGGIKP